MNSNYFSSAMIRSLAAAILLTSVLAAAPGLAQDKDSGSERRGLVLGVNAGFGGSMFDYREGSKNITEDPTYGAMGAMRIGYSFSSSLMLSIEAHGFGGTDDEEDEWGLGAGLMTLTWHPRGNGFFVRTGFGGGGGDFIHPDTDEKITIEDRAAWLFGVGYDWFLNEKISLGVAGDTFGLDAGGATGFDEDCVGSLGMSIQLNWYL